VNIRKISHISVTFEYQESSNINMRNKISRNTSPFHNPDFDVKKPRKVVIVSQTPKKKLHSEKRVETE
jgi:hypothetical protein